MTEVFADRADAGQRLAARIVVCAPLVLGLARGGVPVARVIADVLDAPLDVVVARKIAAPGRPELGLGALTADGPVLYREGALAAHGLTPADLADVCERERAEAWRRQRCYRGDAPAPELAGRDVVLVDDGLATGVTARAAARWVRGHSPRSLVLAVPVAAANAVDALAPEVDTVVYVHRPRRFRSVASWYTDFHSVSDDEVLSAVRDQR